MINTLIIAEAGVNHNGDINKAKALIDAASKAKVDFVKFQTFNSEKLVTKNAQKAKYQLDNTSEKESQLEMLKKLELTENDHRILIDYCKQKKTKFLSTAFDLDSIDLLLDLNIEILKIPSGEITNRPFLEKIGQSGKPVIMSTGMSTLGEIENALEVLIQSGLDKSMLTILHCNTEYPTPMSDVNLRAMRTIGLSFDVNFGYSDHTLGIEVPIAAVTLGATCIEKHFTLDRNLPGPDHKASLEPNELVKMVKSIRNIELALGNPIKKPSPSEIKNKIIARKSIYINRNMKKGEVLQIDDISIKRPGSGISPMEVYEIVGKTTVKDLPKYHMLKYSDIL